MWSSSEIDTAIKALKKMAVELSPGGVECEWKDGYLAALGHIKEELRRARRGE